MIILMLLELEFQIAYLQILIEFSRLRSFYISAAVFSLLEEYWHCTGFFTTRRKLVLYRFFSNRTVFSS